MNLLIPYTKLPDHKDPLFEEFTYGDINKRGGTLKTLRPGDRIFFHAAVKGKQCITAYYIVRQVMETKRVVETSELIQKYKSPHIARWQAGTRVPLNVHAPLIFPGSRSTAVQFVQSSMRQGYVIFMLSGNSVHLGKRV
jgi:hypothetical protein